MAIKIKNDEVLERQIPTLINKITSENNDELLTLVTENLKNFIELLLFSETLKKDGDLFLKIIEFHYHNININPKYTEYYEKVSSLAADNKNKDPYNWVKLYEDLYELYIN